MTQDPIHRPNTRDTLVRRMPWPAGSSVPLATPLQTSVVYAAESPDALDALYEGGDTGWTYAREGHPNAATLAERIDRMEGLTGGVITGSGMAAVAVALLAVAQAGDHCIGADQLYGRSLRLLREDLPRLGIATTCVDITDAQAVAEAIRPETRAILLEVVSNPTMRVADLEGIAALARDKGIQLIVDNTFTTPRALRPADFGADIVVHSITKLLAGHSDATLGYVAARDPDLAETLAIRAATWGVTPSPFDCWIAERGLFSFDLRYDSAERNAKRLADHIAGIDGVKNVLYPGRKDHPDYTRAQQLLGDRSGNMITFNVSPNRSAANALVRAMPMIPFAPTLGDIGTTLSHPATSSHRGLTEAARLDMGITEGTFRASIGIEPIEVLIGEFESGIRASQL